MIKIEKYNQSKTIKITTCIFVILILVFIISTFARYYSTKLNLTNPLIPKYLVEMSIRPFLKKGIILISGLFGVLALSFLKKNLLAFILGLIVITYFIFSNHYIGSWHTQIN
ncbi:hypothetical protein B6A10_12105 [Flavobacterium sp. L1I52]|uniref:DoxX-like family protein n=1 Tax=Flavobacterium pokkalii TaxID=1940408 RepID=A0ABR7USP4_9FLAO|nr:hypothetical protein [Flavobacterium pokkalii]MBD0725924.1 hypothetical protein [Flavobacterium pokkalii]